MPERGRSDYARMPSPATTLKAAGGAAARLLRKP